MFEAMLKGWRAQQAARGLREDAVGARERLMRRFGEFTNEYPWNRHTTRVRITVSVDQPNRLRQIGSRHDRTSRRHDQGGQITISTSSVDHGRGT